MAAPREHNVAELYRAHAEAVRQRLQRLGIEEPELEELVQNVFLIALRRYSQIPKNGEDARRWLLDVARKEAANWHRLYRHTYEEVVDPEVLVAVLAEPEDRENDIAERELVRLALMELGPVDLDVLRRHDIEGESLQVIADWLGLTKSGAHVRLNHARERFVGHLNRLRREVMSRARRATEKGPKL
jgi:RNA polymerase sigma-70 factor (ECF subfamily)